MRDACGRSQTILSVGSGMPYTSLHRLTARSDASQWTWSGSTSKTRGGGEGGGGPLSTETFMYCTAHNKLWGEVCAAVSTVLSGRVTFLTRLDLARAFKYHDDYSYTWNGSWLACSVEPPRGTNTPLPKPATLGFFVKPILSVRVNKIVPFHETGL